MTFKQWLGLQTHRHQSIVGDLARDADQDPRFPNAALVSSYVLYLERRHASPWALKALALAWDEWLRGRGNLLRTAA